jgi:phage tail protein X
MSSATYTTRDGDILDEVVWRYYGRQDAGIVEAVLEANRGLADYGPTLPPGLAITFPAAPDPQPAQRLQLFS